MSEPFLGEIRIVSFEFAPRGWAECAGQLLSISQNTALFALLGTTFGGNGQTTFALPDFRGRLGVGDGTGPGLSSYVLGEVAGEETHTLSLNEMPAHNHGVVVSSANATGRDPQSGQFAKPLINQRFQSLYQSGAANVPGGMSIAAAGGGQAHENRQPYQALLYVIAMQGIFPPRSRPGK